MAPPDMGAAMTGSMRTWAIAIGAMIGLAGPAAAGPVEQLAQAPSRKLVVFTGPTPLYDAIWMADARGFFKDEGLDVEYRLFPTGTTALQTWKSGQGDIVFTGDLPGILYWVANKDYRMIGVLERDSKGYAITAKKTLTKPQDLVGKTIATRVGSNGSFFISEYLRKNGLKPADLTIKNLDAQVMPTALCQGDIDAYFIWAPFGARGLEICGDRVHQLSTAEGYVTGYAVAAARPAWLATAEGKDKATRFLRAALKGKEVAEKDFPAVAKYAQEKYSLSEAATRTQWEINDRAHGFDATFHEDVCKLSKWLQGDGQTKEPLDIPTLIWTDGMKAVDAKRAVDAAGPC